MGVSILPSVAHKGNQRNFAHLIHIFSVFCHYRMLILTNSMVFLCSVVYILILKITIQSSPENQLLLIILKLKMPLWRKS